MFLYKAWRTQAPCEQEKATDRELLPGKGKAKNGRSGSSYNR